MKDGFDSKDRMPLSPLALLEMAVRVFPSAKYSVGVGAIVAIALLALVWWPHPLQLLLGAMVVIAATFVLAVFDQQVRDPRGIPGRAAIFLFITWSGAVMIVLSPAVFLTYTFMHQLPGSAAVNSTSDVPSASRPKSGETARPTLDKVRSSGSENRNGLSASTDAHMAPPVINDGTTVSVVSLQKPGTDWVAEKLKGILADRKLKLVKIGGDLRITVKSVVYDPVIMVDTFNRAIVKVSAEASWMGEPPFFDTQIEDRADGPDRNDLREEALANTLNAMFESMKADVSLASKR